MPAFRWHDVNGWDSGMADFEGNEAIADNPLSTLLASRQSEPSCTLAYLMDAPIFFFRAEPSLVLGPLPHSTLAMFWPSAGRVEGLSERHRSKP